MWSGGKSTQAKSKGGRSCGGLEEKKKDVEGETIIFDSTKTAPIDAKGAISRGERVILSAARVWKQTKRRAGGLWITKHRALVL